jgi:hypothetical protein
MSKRGHEEVRRLPRRPQEGASYWLNSPNGRSDFTHQIFRFPAKFHAPVVRWALGTFGARRPVVVDPFAGSGTVQLEALLRGMNSLGMDIDPLACLIASVKSTPISPRTLRKHLGVLKEALGLLSEQGGRYEGAVGDMTQEEFDRQRSALTIPAIPNIQHWFRRYVIIDLARLFKAIELVGCGQATRDFFAVSAASIIRRVSNADPFPVSGLEVTRVQQVKNEKRTISVFGEYLHKVEKDIASMSRLWSFLQSERVGVRADIRILRGSLLSPPELPWDMCGLEDGIPLIVTSPPYCRSVDYSRRHKLEMFWLGMVKSIDEHLDVSHSYIGRERVRLADWTPSGQFGIKRLDLALRKIADRNPGRMRSVQVYFRSMARAFQQVKRAMTTHGTLVCVIGDSTCCGIPIATSDFLSELAQEYFSLENRFAYAVRNHHMQYGLRNGAGIRQEHVLVLKSRRTQYTLV